MNLTEREQEQLEEIFIAYLQEGIPLTTIVQTLGTACYAMADSDKLENRPSWTQCADLLYQETAQQLPR